MEQKINDFFLKEISKHYRSQGFYFALKSLNYERCAELPYILDQLKPRFKERLNFLDIGSGGESPLPTYLLRHTNWNIYCIDKFNWVHKQTQMAGKYVDDSVIKERLHIIEHDFLEQQFKKDFFDVITNISVIEHFEGSTDSEAMARSAQFLKPGGIYILTTLINEGYFKEFYTKNDVYGEKYENNKTVYYQRHYDLNAVQKRLISPSGLTEVKRIYFGDYGYRFFEKVLQLPKLLRPFKLLYSWAVPLFAKKYLSYSEKPVSYKDMKVNTSSGIILTLRK